VRPRFTLGGQETKRSAARREAGGGSVTQPREVRVFFFLN
jgi:hypothetical protein